MAFILKVALFALVFTILLVAVSYAIDRMAERRERQDARSGR